MFQWRSALVVLITWPFLVGDCAELQKMGVDVNQILGESAPLDGTSVANGLKQALEVGTQRTTSTLSQAGAFRDDPFASVEPAG